jgi:hypothetical protein
LDLSEPSLLTISRAWSEYPLDSCRLMNDKAPVSHPRNQVADVTGVGVHRELPIGELLCFAGVEKIKMKKSPLKLNDVEAQTIGEITTLRA